MRWLILFAGGGIGAILRFALGVWVSERIPTHFPWGTLSVNAVGCFAIGVVATLADEHHLLTPGFRLFLVAGVLGGFTTFSTFGLETFRLVDEGLAWTAAANAAATFAASLAGVVAGVAVTRTLT